MIWKKKPTFSSFLSVFSYQVITFSIPLPGGMFHFLHVSQSQRPLSHCIVIVFKNKHLTKGPFVPCCQLQLDQKKKKKKRSSLLEKGLTGFGFTEVDKEKKGPNRVHNLSSDSSFLAVILD